MKSLNLRLPFSGCCGNKSGGFWWNILYFTRFSHPYRRNSVTVTAYVCCSFIPSSQISYIFPIEYVCTANQFKWRNSQGFMVEWSDQACKVWKVFREIRVGVLQTKSWILLLSLSCAQSKGITHTHTHTHVPPLTRNITRRASRVHFTVCEERLLAALKWKQIFLFSTQVKLKKMNTFFFVVCGTRRTSSLQHLALFCT